MARIPIPNVLPLWDHPASEQRKLSTWKLQMDTLVELTNRQLANDNQLTDADKNILYAHLGAKAARRFEHHPAMAQKGTMAHADFYKAIVSVFGLQIPQAVAFHRLRTCRQAADESTVEFLALLRNLQADCDYDKFDADLDVACCLAANCHNAEAQKRMFTTPPSLSSYVNIRQAVENADASAAAVRNDTAVRSVAQSRPGAALQQRQRHRSPGRGQPERRCPPSRTTCDGCRSDRHPRFSDTCPAKGRECRNCGLVGHFVTVCRSPRAKDSSKQDRLLTTSRAMNAVRRSDNPLEYRCTLSVIHNGTECKVEGLIDTSAAVSNLPWSTFQRNWPAASLSQNEAELRNFDGSPIHGVRGKLACTLDYDGRHAESTLFVLDTVKSAT